MDEMKQLLIPNRLKVGYQERLGTYNGKLAYVIYYDSKGTLRKETSWENWRDKKIEPSDYINEPTDGFVLNKSGGGQRQHSGWNVRNEFIRVYDPRGFEFEISLPNLLFILKETDCSRGKGLEGKFVYAWDSKELVLLPVGSADYKHSRNFTALQSQNVKFKDMVPGTTFITKKQQDLVYLGKFDCHFMCRIRQSDDLEAIRTKGKKPRMVFWDEANNKFVFLRELKSIATLKSDAIHPNFADFIAHYAATDHGSVVIELFLKEVSDEESDSARLGARWPYYTRDPWFYEESPGVFVEVHNNYFYDHGWTNRVESISIKARCYLKDGMLIRHECEGVGLAPGFSHSKWGYRSITNQIPWRQPTTHRLFAKTENGNVIQVVYNTFQEV